MAWYDFLKQTIGIDAGTEHLRIIHKGRIVFNEKSIISINSSTNKMTGVGNSFVASDVVLKPFDYTITDFHAFEYLLRGVTKKTLEQNLVFPRTYKMFLSISVSTTEAEKRVFRDSAEHSGASDVYFIRQPNATALGMDLSPGLKNFLMIDIGASKVEISVFQKDEIVAYGMARFGINTFKKAIENYLRRNYQYSISASELEQIIQSIDFNGNSNQSFAISVGIQITNEELIHVLEKYLLIIDETFLDVLESRNIVDAERLITGGIFYTGGGSLNVSLRDRISLRGKINHYPPKDAFLDAVKGVGDIIDHQELYPRLIEI